jgi:hypothetical protein
MSISLSAASFRAKGVANTRAPSALLAGVGDACFCCDVGDDGGGGGGGGVDFGCSACFGGAGGGTGAAAAGAGVDTDDGAPVSSEAL